jgi:hypothetical protein
LIFALIRLILQKSLILSCHPKNNAVGALVDSRTVQHDDDTLNNLFSVKILGVSLTGG